jgi:hypothetical protein
MSMMTITKIWNYPLSLNEEVFQVVERGRNFESRRNVYREKGRDRVTLFFRGWLTSFKNWVWFSGVKNSFGVCVCAFVGCGHFGLIGGPMPVTTPRTSLHSELASGKEIPTFLTNQSAANFNCKHRWRCHTAMVAL